MQVTLQNSFYLMNHWYIKKVIPPDRTRKVYVLKCLNVTRQNCHVSSCDGARYEGQFLV